MNPFAGLDLGAALDGAAGTPVLTMLLRLVVAAVLGGLVAYRPWRRLFGHVPPPATETAQAQTLIAVAGALMVGVIGDSVARAFGLVGLGAFIRFRSGIKDPRDAAVLFVMIGVGMACGVGALPIALLATLFCGSVLVIFDLAGRGERKRVRVGITLERPTEAFPVVREIFPALRTIEIPNSSPPIGKVVIELETTADYDAAAVLAALEARGLGVHNVAFEES
jgi:uncharacterized membrane protein YhiD involved in acid resistance